jgi:hypothetical protein
LGFEEFKINVQRVKDGFSRTKRNIQLKEQIERDQNDLKKW